MPRRACYVPNMPSIEHACPQRYVPKRAFKLMVRHCAASVGDADKTFGSAKAEPHPDMHRVSMSRRSAMTERQKRPRICNARGILAAQTLANSHKVAA